MMDAVLYNSKIAEEKSTILGDLDLSAGQYLLATVHRASNTDSKQNLTSIINAFVDCGETIVFPVHPRTAKYMKQYGPWEKARANLVLTEPVGYLDILKLTGSAKKVLTDSGGLQKEAYMLGVPCVTLWENTEWVETVEAGWNVLVGAEYGEILESIASFQDNSTQADVFGDGNASGRICEILNPKS
ncbi:hypothetical protein EFE41_08435 [Methanohalophilus portucalensis FDF-1]|uniref:UDP-N-acetylglucosamine 2-epimerase domain-containing protein n=3 Tax=Methanohalophilus portucalensis TaxID=39664 RepID=A0A3M9L9T3_9EURY|nr:hypothetical protein BKM01_04470 [Methanohalophilus portucalensis]RNI10072.1 hypothetical protein EFE41_08435 [Methanohalophilus portucalensis FDF-1]